MFTVQDLCQLLPKHMTLSNCKKKKLAQRSYSTKTKHPLPQKTKQKRANRVVE